MKILSSNFYEEISLNKTDATPSRINGESGF